MHPAPEPLRRARRTLLCAVALGLGATALTAASAAGQESPTPTTTPEPTTTTAPPVTIVLDDGDIGILPPGADGGGTPTTPPPDPNAPLGPDTDTPEIDAELPIVVLPDPTPGLNAALAAIDVSRATEKLAEGEEARRTAEDALDQAYAARRAAVAERRAAGETLVAAKRVVDQLAVDMVIHGDVTGLAPMLGEASLDDLHDLELSEVAADKVQRDLEVARAAYRRTVATELDADAALADATRAERQAQVAYLDLRRAKDQAIAKAEEARRQVGPAILGPAVLEQEDLVAWYRTFYRADPPVAPIEAIIESYLRVGGEEGVAGDIAFAQAILETGGFRSGHARGFNFAGIGAYDSCSPTCGFRFPDLDQGVRAHIHLLRAYADPSLTSAQLASKPNRLVAPERVGVRGCCQRWTQLTGVWATDPNYDRKVLGIYRLMVETARARDRAAA